MSNFKKDILHENEDKSDVRLNRFLSDAGFCSRREADRLIEAGRVTVDGTKAELGTRVRPGQVVKVGSKVVRQNDRMVLIAFNKPRGIVCTTDRVREKNNIIDYIHYPERIYPIGRLDKDSEGLLLLTNQGELANEIMHAGNLHEKEYLVTVDQPFNSAFLKKMREGVELKELGVTTRPCRVESVGPKTFRIVLTQGLNRPIRRRCEELGSHVVTLKRVRMMNILLGKLNTGDYRRATPKEMEELERALEQARELREGQDEETTE